MKQSEDYRAAAEAFLEALGRSDWEGLATLFTEDVVWTLPGNSKISGRAEGIAAVVQRARTITSYGLTFTLKHILLGQSGMALSLNNTARRGDLVLDEHLATVCGFRAGKISRIDSFLSDVPMADAFFV
jgi:ketosteroid isomerase-like protein